MELLAVGNVCRTQIEHKVYGTVFKTLESLSYEIIKIRLFRSGDKSVLQFTLERSNGEPVSINDCDKASKCISAILDTREDFIDSSYNLEVMSSGINKPLTRPIDFERSIGQRVRIKVTEKIEGVGVFYGVISKFDGKVIILNQEMSSVAINFSNISDAALDLIEKEERIKEDRTTPEYKKKFEGKRVSNRKFGGKREDGRSYSRTNDGERSSDRRRNRGDSVEREDRTNSNRPDRKFGGKREDGRSYGRTNDGERSSDRRRKDSVEREDRTNSNRPDRRFGTKREDGRSYSRSNDGERSGDRRRKDSVEREDRTNSNRPDRKFGGKREDGRSYSRTNDGERGSDRRRNREDSVEREDRTNSNRPDRKFGGKREDGRSYSRTNDDNRSSDRRSKPRDENFTKKAGEGRRNGLSVTSEKKFRK